MDIRERIKEDLKTAINNRKQAEQLKDKWGYQYWRGRVDALDLLLLSEVRCMENKIGMDKEIEKRVEKCLEDLKEIGKILERGGIIWLKK